MQRLYIHNGQSFRDALRPEQAEVSRIFADWDRDRYQGPGLNLAPLTRQSLLPKPGL